MFDNREANIFAQPKGNMIPPAISLLMLIATVDYIASKGVLLEKVFREEKAMMGKTPTHASRGLFLFNPGANGLHDRA
jgi:hypothetical protein